ncbi:MAG: hypothetical protein ACRD4L_12620 [Pyrinomonadaceae bacterium]
MADETIITTLEQNLKGARRLRASLVARLAEIEKEGEVLQAELTEIDSLIEQSESAIFRLISPSFAASLQESRASRVQTGRSAVRDNMPQEGTGIQPRHKTRYNQQSLDLEDIVVTSEVFAERTITQATSLLLREAGEPMHVNDIYRRLIEGGFSFTGHNPTISIAVSLNRNRRFRKTAPGTFDLVMREATQAS